MAQSWTSAHQVCVTLYRRVARVQQHPTTTQRLHFHHVSFSTLFRQYSVTTTVTTPILLRPEDRSSSAAQMNSRQLKPCSHGSNAPKYSQYSGNCSIDVMSVGAKPLVRFCRRHDSQRNMRFSTPYCLCEYHRLLSETYVSTGTQQRYSCSWNPQRRSNGLDSIQMHYYTTVLATAPNFRSTIGTGASCSLRRAQHL